jgi:hypothetical protein
MGSSAAGRIRNHRWVSAVAVAAFLTAVPSSEASSALHATTARSTARTTTTTVAVAADAFVRESAPSVNTGTDRIWRADGRAGDSKRAYLKFVVPAPAPGMRVSHVTLLAHVNQTAAEDSTGLTVFRTGQKWAERRVTWKAQPILRDRVASTDPSYVRGEWVRWDVTDGLTELERTAGGTVSFAVTTEEKRQLGFSAKESGRPARLVVRTEDLGPSLVDADTPAAVVHGWGLPIGGDEFNYVGAPDRALWDTYDSVGHNGQGVRSPGAWHVDGNVVTVTGDADGTTGGMAALFARRSYGRWEVRMRTSARDPEYHPVLLLWPDDGPGDRCPEIDYGEGSGDTTRVSFFLHYGCDSQQTYARRSIDTTRWHNYAVDWTPLGVTGYVDGVKWFEDTDLSHQPPGSMHQTIQLDWFPDGSTTTPSWMQVDWVRVYAPFVINLPLRPWS